MLLDLLRIDNDSGRRRIVTVSPKDHILGFVRYLINSLFSSMASQPLSKATCSIAEISFVEMVCCAFSFSPTPFTLRTITSTIVKVEAKTKAMSRSEVRIISIALYQLKRTVFEANRALLIRNVLINFFTVSIVFHIDA